MQRVRARCFTFHLSPGCDCVVCCGLLLLGGCLVFVGLCLFLCTWVFARHLPGANRASSWFTTDDWMTVRASSAHGMSSKKKLFATTFQWKPFLWLFQQ